MYKTSWKLYYFQNANMPTDRAPERYLWYILEQILAQAYQFSHGAVTPPHEGKSKMALQWSK